ncbi:hypothetical protein [Carboxylicivirga sp. RSCT41]|uniref:hypothetical protein n=1 Tax=Carboxylicivirga agarovorans TaxID=3417570 RepID=UPI003D33F3F1
MNNLLSSIKKEYFEFRRKDPATPAKSGNGNYHSGVAGCILNNSYKTVNWKG